MNTTSTQPQRSPALTFVYILVGLLYGSIFLGGLAWPLGYYMFALENSMYAARTANLQLAEGTFIFLLMATGGMVAMYSALRSVADKQAVEIWTMSALGVAPFSGYFYLCVAKALGFLTGALFTVANITIYLFGFYLPFVLLVVWVRYRCRQDEF